MFSLQVQYKVKKNKLMTQIISWWFERQAKITVKHIHFFPDFLIPPPTTERKQNSLLTKENIKKSILKD